MLTLESSPSTTNIEFLDIRITLRNQHYVTTMFDKRTHHKYRNMPIFKYPHINSFIPNSIKYNIVLSQAHRFARRCSTRRGFIYHTAKLLFELHHIKQYNTTRLFARLRRFLYNSTPLYFDTHPRLLLALIRRRFHMFTSNPPNYVVSMLGSL